MFYKDVCGEDLNKCHILVRGIQLGLVDRGVVQRHVKESSLAPPPWDWEDILSKIKGRLGDDFNVTL